MDNTCSWIIHEKYIAIHFTIVLERYFMESAPDNLMFYIDQIKNSISDPHIGLPEDVFEFISTVTPMVNVDLVVCDKMNQILLSWRDDEHCGTGWHIPGGIIRYKETREDRIIKTALREYGCEVTFDQDPIMVSEIIMPQEVRGHFICFTYRCYLPEDYKIPDNLLWDEKYSSIEAAGKLKWHNKNPDQWVNGQRQFYESLFERHI